MSKYLSVLMPDGSKWGVLVDDIARNRAEHYAPEFGGDVEASLKADTLPLFAADSYEIEDWAANNMNFCDCESRMLAAPSRGNVDYEDGWCNGAKEVVDYDPG